MLWSRRSRQKKAQLKGTGPPPSLLTCAACVAEPSPTVTVDATHAKETGEQGGEMVVAANAVAVGQADTLAPALEILPSWDNSQCSGASAWPESPVVAALTEEGDGTAIPTAEEQGADAMRLALVQDGLDLIVLAASPGGFPQVCKGRARLFATGGGSACLHWRWYSKGLFRNRAPLGAFDEGLAVPAKRCRRFVNKGDRGVMVEWVGCSGIIPERSLQRVLFTAESAVDAYRLRLALHAWAERYCASNERPVDIQL